MVSKKLINLKKLKKSGEKLTNYVENEYKFNFTLVDYMEEEAESITFAETVDFKLCTHEYHMFFSYFLNYLKKIQKCYKNNPLLHHEILEVYKMIRIAFWDKFLGKDCIKSLENKIAELPYIQNILQKSMEEDGYPSITTKALFSCEEYKKLSLEFFKILISKIEKNLKKDTQKKLKKSFYTENLNVYLDLLGIKSPKIKKLAEFCFYMRLDFFTRYLPSCKMSIKNLCTYTAVKNVLLSELEPYKRLLFSIEENKSGQREVFFNYTAKRYCYQEYKNKKDFVANFISEMKTPELSEKDFNYITQIKYLKLLIQDSLENNREGTNILLYGEPGCGKTALSRVLINTLDCKGYEVATSTKNKSDLGEMSYSNSENPLSNIVRIDNFIILNSILKENKNAIILYDEAEDFFRKENDVSQSKGFINDFLEKNKTPTIWTTNDLCCMEESFLRRFTYVLNVEQPPKKVYEEILDKIAKKYEITLDISVKNLYTTYRPSLAIIEKTLSNFKRSNSLDINNLKKDILDTLQGQHHGEKVKDIKINKFTFNPKLINSSENLEGILNNIKRIGRTDFSMLLYGVPGSSKTSFGRYVGEQLNMKVINKNYTELASCWVGETEHNIKKLFEEAKRDEAIIILDEADVLLQDRTKAARSWEISQVEALLTEMEDHPYPFIMTTNLYNNLDPAVMRRFLYKIKHDYLTEDQVKLAFKHFFNLEITEKLYLSKLTSGDFAVVKKQAEYENKLQDKDWLLDRLNKEMNQKKADYFEKTILL